jgi:hypothetical protein
MTDRAPARELARKLRTRVGCLQQREPREQMDGQQRNAIEPDDAARLPPVCAPITPFCRIARSPLPEG